MEHMSTLGAGGGRGVSQVLSGRAFPWHGTRISLAHVQGRSCPVRTCAVTVTPRKKRETCWDRLCWAAFGLGSCRYQGTPGSASPPVASSQLLSCPWGSRLFFPWLWCFPDTSGPWLLPQVPKGPALRPGAIAQSPGREAALAWASLAQRFPASSVLARAGAGCGSAGFMGSWRVRHD